MNRTLGRRLNLGLIYYLIHDINDIDILPGIQENRIRCPRQLKWPQKDLVGLEDFALAYSGPAHIQKKLELALLVEVY